MATLSAEYHVDSNQKRGIAFFRFFLLMHDCCDLWGQYYFAKENSWAGFGGQERVDGGESSALFLSAIERAVLEAIDGGTEAVGDDKSMIR